MGRRAFAWGSASERRQADLFLADLLGRSSRQRRREWSDPVPEFDHDPPPVVDPEASDELVDVCGFFGPNNVRRTEQEIRNAVVARANAEWTNWHPAGVPRPESDAALFGGLVGYSLAQNADIAPDHLTALQAAALGTINYTPLLSATNAVTGVRDALITAASVPNNATMRTHVAEALRQARQANKDAGIFRSWSAVFVVSCLRGAAIALGLEAVIGSPRRHIGKNELLLAAIRHSEYAREARIRRAGRRRGTYHAFTPAERAPALGDVIVLDRRTLASAAQVITLAALPQRLTTHGDIIVEVAPTFVVTIGGNLTSPSPPAVGESVRKRRYPRNAQGFLVVDRQQLFAQEDDTAALAALPLTSTDPLHDRSTARIFALLSPVEECAAVPGQPHGGGVLT
jgi:hypothetical protein